MAAQIVAEHMVAEVSDSHGLAPVDRPQVRCSEADGLVVRFAPPHNAAFEEAVRAALAELPMKNQKMVRMNVAGVN